MPKTDFIDWNIVVLTVASEEDQESAVKKMLSYVNKMPSQEKFQPSPVPFVSFTVDESNVKYHDPAIQNCTVNRIV